MPPCPFPGAGCCCCCCCCRLADLCRLAATACLQTCLVLSTSSSLLQPDSFPLHWQAFPLPSLCSLALVCLCLSLALPCSLPGEWWLPPCLLQSFAFSERLFQRLCSPRQGEGTTADEEPTNLARCLFPCECLLAVWGSPKPLHLQCRHCTHPVSPGLFFVA